MAAACGLSIIYIAGGPRLAELVKAAARAMNEVVAINSALAGLGAS